MVSYKVIISAMPGTGKSHYAKKHPKTCLDIDSSQFKGDDGLHDCDAYIKAIEKSIKKYEIVFVSSHQAIRQRMERDGFRFFYTAWLPNKMEAARDRVLNRDTPQNNQLIAGSFEPNWDTWMSTVGVGDPIEIYRIDETQYVSDVIKEIKASF